MTIWLSVYSEETNSEISSGEERNPCRKVDNLVVFFYR